MIGLVLVTHGRLADELIAATEHIVGAQRNIRAVCIGPDDDMEQRRDDILNAVTEVDSGAGANQASVDRLAACFAPRKWPIPRISDKDP